MNYYSLSTKTHFVTFKEAVINGLAPDKGLYFPEKITPLPNYVLDNINDLTKEEIAYEAIASFVGNHIESKRLKAIINEVLNFDIPLTKIKEAIYSLELFHGPTLAFKDVGARFMARCLNEFSAQEKNVTVLVATSGDTGSAVANAFYDLPNIEVVILYPKGKVSPIQEKQLTTLGKNITALEVLGDFDKCQAMVKNAFVDSQLLEKRTLTSANSINVARWLPQMWYYFFAYQQLTDKNKPLAVAVPSGNFGNICAGVLAKKLGLPIKQFIACNNSNDTIARYLNNNTYEIHETIATISNAMDVSDPSNFVRIEALYNNDLAKLKKEFCAYSYSDNETRNTIKEVYNNYNYTLDPHGAIGYLGLRDYITKNPEYQGIFLETAHPIKFPETVETIIKETIPIPDRVKDIMNKEKLAIGIENYDDLKTFLLK